MSAALSFPQPPACAANQYGGAAPHHAASAHKNNAHEFELCINLVETGEYGAIERNGFSATKAPLT
jgi:hypothetical protein